MSQCLQARDGKWLQNLQQKACPIKNLDSPKNEWFSTKKNVMCFASEEMFFDVSR